MIINVLSLVDQQDESDDPSVMVNDDTDEVHGEYQLHRLSAHCTDVNCCMRIYARTYVCTCACVRECARVYVNMYVCVCIYIYII